MKRVRKIASDFAMDMRINSLPIEMSELEEIANYNDWNIVTYSKGRDFIKSQNLEKYYYTSNGFTYASCDCTIIFIRDDLEYLEKINVICHEIGHLVLKHIEIGSKQKSITGDNKDKIQELEADAFALELQAPTYLMQSLRITNIQTLINKGIFSKGNAKLRYKYYLKDVYINNFRFKSLLVVAVASIITLTSINIIRNFNIDRNYNNLTMEQTEITADIIEITTVQFNVSEIVYITKTGSKYHKKDCYYISDKESLEIKLNEAQKEYLPCDICFNK
jgi:hypothetical protein